MASTPVRRRAARGRTLPAQLGLMRRRLLADWTAMLAIVLVIWLIAVSLTLIPRLLARMTDNGVQGAVTQATADLPGITFGLQSRIAPTGSDAFAAVTQEGATFQYGLPAALQGVITGLHTSAEAQYFTMSNPLSTAPDAGLFQPLLAPRYQSGIDQHITLVAGRMPQVIAPVSPSIFQGNAEGLGSAPITAFEIALDQQAARALRVQVGDTVLLRPDIGDPMAAAVPSSNMDYVLAMRVSGIFRPVDPTSRYWSEEPSLIQPSVASIGSQDTIAATGLITPAAYPMLVGQTNPVDWHYTFRYEINPRAVNAANLRTLSRQLRSLLLTHGPAIGFSQNPGAVVLQSPILDTLQTVQQQRSFVVAFLTVVTLGLASVAAVLALLVALIVVERWRAGTTLLRSRGATARQVLGARFIAMLILVIPATVLGVASALLIVPASEHRLALRFGVAIAVIAVNVTTLAVWPVARTPLGRLLGPERNDAPAVSARWRLLRLGAEGMVVILVVVGLYLVRRRGLVGQASAVSSIDPYLALLPVLAGLAAGILTLRLFPLPVRALSHLAERGRGLIAWIALRRVSRRPERAGLSILAILLAVSVAGFIAVVQHSLATAQQDAAWQQVGAAFRVDAANSGSLPASWDPRTAAGVQATAPGVYLPDIGVGSNGFAASGATLLAIDPDAYARVTAGTPAAVSFPQGFFAPPADDAVGSPGNPIPAIVSTNWPSSGGAIRQFTIGASTFTIRVVATRETFPSLPASEFFVVVPNRVFEAAKPNQDGAFPMNRVFIRAAGSASGALAQQVASHASGASLTSQAGALARIEGQPFVGDVTDLYRFGLALAGLYAAVVGIAALILSARSRARDLSYLRTLGMAPRQGLVMTLAEQLPPIVIAAIAGAALGIGMAYLVAPGLDLAAFTGRVGVSASVRVGWWELILVTVGLAVVVFVAVIAVGVVTWRRNLASVLRVGER